ncbi:TPR-like protein [Ceratobasidium sp. AG-Ba]|nr:TPR-like protein [Ceratobasidium sp. AG-Ba]
MTSIPDPFQASPRLSPTNEITIQGINHPSLFLPIPSTDPLTALLSKYVPLEARPQRDLIGRYEEQTLDALVMSNSWRALARMAKDQIVATSETEVALILDLWSLRLSSLARMRLFNQATAECTNLYAVLGTVSPPALRRIVPYELDILRARTMYWSGDFRGYLDELVRLVRMCKRATRSGGGAKGTIGAVWAERGTRTGMMIVTQLIEMQDYVGALTMLRPLADSHDASPELLFALARIAMESGNSASAHALASRVVANPGVDGSTESLTRALEAAMIGRWGDAEEVLKEAWQKDRENAVIANNLAVVLLSCGKLDEAIELLEGMLTNSPATFVAVEPFLYNLGRSDPISHHRYPD